MLLFLLSSIGFSADNNGQLPSVIVDKVKIMHETSPKRYVGSVEAIKYVEIKPRVTGEIWKINFTEGSLVKVGDLLYEIEDTTYKAAVDQLLAQKEQIEASVKFQDAQFNRSAKLLTRDVIAESSHDEAILDLVTAKAKIKEISAALTDAENNLSYTKIHAPIPGLIGKSNFTEGNLITPQDGKLTDIMMIAPIYVRFSISERVFRRDFGGSEGIKDNAIVRIILADNTEYNETASVSLIDNKINRSINSITLWAKFANADNKLLPGSFVTVLIGAKQEKPFIAIPSSALIATIDGYVVYALDENNTVLERPVRTGTVTEQYQAILSGLDENDRIIVDGTHKVRPGVKIHPVAPDNGGY